MSVQTIEFGNGQTLNLNLFSGEETAKWEADFPRVIAPLSREGKPLLAEAFMRHKKELFILAQAAKNDVDGAGTFNGLNATVGFGFQPIRPDHIVENTQTKLFTTTLAALTAGLWYGLWHNGATGAAYNATPLYNRKEYAMAILGFMDLSPTTLVEEIQLEKDGKPLPVWRVKETLAGGDFPFYELPYPEYIRPRSQYRSQFRVNAAAGSFTLVPVGLAFPTSTYMRQTAPVGPTIAAP